MPDMPRSLHCPPARPSLHCTAPPRSPLLRLQLRRRAGIPTDAASDETYAAFGAALKEHEARLQVQYAGGCPLGSSGLRCRGRLGSTRGGARLAPPRFAGLPAPTPHSNKPHHLPLSQVHMTRSSTVTTSTKNTCRARWLEGPSAPPLARIRQMPHTGTAS